MLRFLSFSLNNFQCRIKEKEKEKEICTKMNNQYMFVCPRCLETYSSNVKVRKKCKKCGTTLNKMPISTVGWRSMNDNQKEQYKKEHCGIVDDGFYYLDPNNTPLNWHEWNRIFRIPLTLIEAVLAILYILRISSSSSPILIVLIVLIALIIPVGASVVFLVNAKKRNRAALYSIYLMEAIEIISGFADLLFTRSARWIVLVLGGLLEFIYYLRRKNIFTPSYILSLKSSKSKVSTDSNREFLDINVDKTSIDWNKETEEGPRSNSSKEYYGLSMNEESNGKPLPFEQKREIVELNDTANSFQTGSLKDIVEKKSIDEVKKNEENDMYERNGDGSNAILATKREPNPGDDVLSEIKFCRNCGTKLSADAVFCRKCGTRIKQENG